MEMPRQKTNAITLHRNNYKDEIYGIIKFKCNDVKFDKLNFINFVYDINKYNITS